MKTYKQLLLDPKWQRKRMDILNRDEFTCQCCYNTEKTLHVHHLIYFPDHMPWEYEDHHLVTLCEDCHKEQKAYDIRKMWADLSISHSTMLYVGFLLKKMIPEYVNRPEATEQAIWSFMYDAIKQKIGWDESTASEFRAFKEKYKKEENG
jgi:hypothetical protein